MINNSYTVLTPVTSGGDVVVTGNILKITGCPPIDLRYLMNIGAGFKDAVVGTPGVWTITPPATPTAGANYAYNILQAVPNSQPAALGQPAQYTLQNLRQQNTHTVPTGGESKVVMMQAMEKSLIRFKDPAVGFQFTEVTDGTTGVCVITAAATAPYLYLTDANTPPAAWVSFVNTTETAIVVSAATNATPIVLTTTADTWVVGQVVRSAGQATNTAANGTFRISATNGTTTVTLEGSVGNGATGTGTIVHVISQSRGQYADLVRQGVDPALLVSTHQYGQITINYNQTEQADTSLNTVGWSQTIYVDYTANTTFYASFVTALATALGANWITPTL